MIHTSGLLRVKSYTGHIYLITLLIFSYFVIIKKSQGQLWKKIIKENKNGSGLHHRQGNGWQHHPRKLNGFSGLSISPGRFRTCTTSSSSQRFMDSCHKPRSPTTTGPIDWVCQPCDTRSSQSWTLQKDPWNSWPCSCRDLFTFK